jgi:LacI family transcriptional regulator
MKDVAREAGLSVTTVDRALNGRSVVREETLRNIAQAAQRVGYHARGLLEHRLIEQVPEVRLGFVLIKKKHEFYQSFTAEIEAACAARTDFRIKPIIRYTTSQSAEEFAALLSGFRNRVSAVAAVAINHQKLNQAVQELNDNGVPVFSLLNDFGQGLRQGYIGMNNMKIGRLAAWMLTHAVKQPGKLGIFVGGNRWHGHDLREVGFRSYIRESAPSFTVLETLVNLETREVTYEATVDLLRRHPDLRGIYVAGGGMEGAIAALREEKSPGDVALIVNELTRESRAALLDGYAVMVIRTPLKMLCTDLVDMMTRTTQKEPNTQNSQHFLEPHIVLAEML